MSIVSSILFASMLSLHEGAPDTLGSAALEGAFAGPDSGRSPRSATASIPRLTRAHGGAAGASPSRGWPLPFKLLLAEASIAALASSGHVADAVGEPPESGAFVLGSGLVALGAAGAVFAPWALASAGTEEDRRGAWSLLGGCVALMAAGGYDLYLHANHDPSSAWIFRDNVIALNAVPLAVWIAGRLAPGRARAR